MLSYTQAKNIAEKMINADGRWPKDELVVVDGAIIELLYAWIFPHSTKRWLQEDINYALGGNSPIFVE